MTPRLVLITTNYPYTHTGGEVMFVEPEVRELAREFGSLTVVPQYVGGSLLDVPPGVVVDTGLASIRRRWWLAAYAGALLERAFWKECARGLRRGGWVGFARVWRWSAAAWLTLRWVRENFDPAQPTLFYTYWRGGATLALAAYAENQPCVAAVTRVHRYELYENAFNPPFQPWHPALYERLALTATISRDGLDYLLASGVDPQRIELHRLGTEALPRRAEPSSDDVIRVVSCSNASAVKRVPLIAQALIELARMHPQRRLHWTHFGDGPELASVRATLATAPANLDATLPGRVSNATVLGHYASEPTDAFVLLSSSEGLPVALQEAASAGLPIVATDVGGVREIVGDDNGALLPADCSAADAARALAGVLVTSDATARRAMGDASFRRWSAEFSARHNHARFARRLRDLLDQLAAPGHH